MPIYHIKSYFSWIIDIQWKERNPDYQGGVDNLPSENFPTQPVENCEEAVKLEQKALASKTGTLVEF